MHGVELQLGTGRDGAAQKLTLVVADTYGQRRAGIHNNARLLHLLESGGHTQHPVNAGFCRVIGKHLHGQINIFAHPANARPGSFLDDMLQGLKLRRINARTYDCRLFAFGDQAPQFLGDSGQIGAVVYAYPPHLLQLAAHEHSQRDSRIPRTHHQDINVHCATTSSGQFPKKYCHAGSSPPVPPAATDPAELPRLIARPYQWPD